MSAAAEFPWTPPDPKTELERIFESMFERMFENVPLALGQIGPLGTMTALNPAAQRLLSNRYRGERSVTLPNLSLLDLVHPESRAESERFLNELFEGERDSFQFDASPVVHGSKLRCTAWRVSGVNGQPDFALVLAHDNSAAFEAEQRLRQAQKLEAVGRLAGGVAHDFNNLLTGVLLYCDLLMAGLEPANPVRKYAEEIRTAGLQATGLVKQLLAVARPTDSEPCLLSINQIVEGMRNLLVRLIGENIELKFQLDPKLGLVKMDPTQAQQILLNLVLNARDALSETTSETTSAGGKISIETRSCKVQVLPEPQPGARASIPCASFVVSDNGCGMDAVTRAHLFEAFFTTKAGSKGTGLGLATVYDIVTSNGGLIHVDSAPASGTRVTILLPLLPEAAMIPEHEISGQDISEKDIPEQPPSAVPIERGGIFGHRKGIMP
jgi:two-component system cell cycle sensor histidine kinase/response regulator CckA